MTDFLSCIATAVETGKLGKKQEEEAQGIYEQAYAKSLGKGFGDEASQQYAAMETLKHVTEYKRNQRWELVNEMRAQHALYTEIMALKDPTNVLASRVGSTKMNSLMDRSELRYKSIKDDLESLMVDVAEQYRATHLGWVKPLEHMDEIVYGAYGHEDISEAGKILSDQVQAVYEHSLNLLNAQGAHIRLNENFRLPQKMDRFSVHNAGMDQFVQDFMEPGVLAWDEMRWHGKAIAEEDRGAILKETWKNIIEEGHGKGLPGAKDGLSLASQVSRQRFFRIASAEAWLKLNAKYGKGNVYEQLMGHIDSTARHTALMEIFGPNPENGRRFAIKTLDKMVALQAKGMDATKFERLDAAKSAEITAFDHQFDILAQNVDPGKGDALVQTATALKNLASAGGLGMVGIQSLSDISYGAAFRSFYKAPQLDLIMRYIDGFMHLKNIRKEALNSAIGVESLLRYMHENNETFVGNKFVKFTQHLSEMNFIATGASAITDVGHAVSGIQFAQLLAKFRDKPLDQVPGAELLRNLGITEKDWELVKGTPLYEPDYYNFGKAQHLRPIDMMRNATTDEERAAAGKFAMAQQMWLRGGVPASNIGGRALLGGFVNANSAAGQIVRASTQFMLFPAGVMFNHWKMAMSAPEVLGRNGKLARVGTLLFYTTIFGAVLQQLRALASGQGILNMDPIEHPKFWFKSIVLGGAGGIIGDFLWNNVAAMNGPNSDIPIVSLAKKVGAPVGDLFKWAEIGMGKQFQPKDEPHLLGDLGTAAFALLPKPAPTKLIMERLFMDGALRESDPAAYNRKLVAARKREQDQYTQDWWPMEGQH